MTDLLIHRGIVDKNYKENLLKSFKQSFKKGYGIEWFFTIQIHCPVRPGVNKATQLIL